jgi:Biopolymer transport proteins
VAIDPTRGALLGMLVLAPDVGERVRQGGIIGYIIIALGIVGLILAAVRIVYLQRVKQKVNSQLTDISNPKDDNPLGRVLVVPTQLKEYDMETLESLLDEAILRETPKLESGQSLLKLFAAVAPLLGLLGTVTGMIATFQSISLFGTGDPKLMASGISQALVTTMLGLVAAIPLLFMHALVANRSKTLVQILDEQSAGLVSRVIESRK